MPLPPFYFCDYTVDSGSVRSPVPVASVTSRTVTRADTSSRNPCAKTTGAIAMAMRRLMPRRRNAGIVDVNPEDLVGSQPHETLDARTDLASTGHRYDTGWPLTGVRRTSTAARTMGPDRRRHSLGERLQAG
jgi:hypothetical protein